MSEAPTIHLRTETKPLEHRCILTPSTIKALIAAGYKVKCEHDPQRCFTDEELISAGAAIVPANSWQDAPLDHIIVGLKELPATDTFPLRHTHLHFAHVFKHQPGWADVLQRFDRGGGSLLDIEFLDDPNRKGRLLSPSSFYAGFGGGILAVQAWAHQLEHPDGPPLGEAVPYHSEEEALKATARALRIGSSIARRFPRVAIIGAAGKCGLGAVAVCRRLGLPFDSIWECEPPQTTAPDFSDKVVKCDILVNCIYLSSTIKPFVTLEDVNKPDRRLSVICDVSCDGDDAHNPLPVYTGHTTFKNPTRLISTTAGPALDVIAIDHLPSLIPRAASEDCARQLLPALLALRNWQTAPEWRMARELFQEKLVESRTMARQTVPARL